MISRIDKNVRDNSDFIERMNQHWLIKSIIQVGAIVEHWGRNRGLTGSMKPITLRKRGLRVRKMQNFNKKKIRMNRKY